jgi:hypothetical protein
VACASIVIEHRLAPPRHPQTNCMVVRFNGRISELQQQTCFESRADLERTSLNHLKLYNHHFPQRAIGTKTPIQALKNGNRKSLIYSSNDQTGLDMRHFISVIGHPKFLWSKRRLSKHLPAT